MTPLRQRMIEDMQVRNLAPHTQTGISSICIAVRLLPTLSRASSTA